MNLPACSVNQNAVAVYGKDRKVDYLSEAKAAALAAIVDPLDGVDAYLVGGTSVLETSIRLWVDLPRVPALRTFAKDYRG